MVLKAPVQRIVNLIVIGIVFVALVAGALVVVTGGGATGTLLGKLLSSKSNLQDMLASLSPSELAEALERNPEMTSKLLKELDPQLIADGLNNNPDFLPALIPLLDAKSLARVVNETGDFAAGLLHYLDPATVASAVNDNGDFLTGLLGYLDSQVIASVLNQNEAFLTDSMRAMDPAPLAEAINSNGPFLTGLIARMDPVVLGGAINQNPSMAADLMGNLDSVVIAGVVNANSNFLAGLLGALNPSALAAATNASPAFLSRLLGRLDPAVVAGALNENAQAASGLADYLSTGLYAAIAGVTANNAPWLSNLLDLLSTQSLADTVNGSWYFASQLVGVLNPPWVAGIANMNPSLIYRVLDVLTPQLVAEILNDPRIASPVLPLLNASVIGTALAGYPQIISQLLPLLSQDLAVGMAEAMNANPDLTDGVLSALDPAALAGALDASTGPFMTDLLSHLDAGTAQAIAQGLNANAAKPAADSFLKGFVIASNPATVAAAVNQNPGFLEGLIASLNGAAASAVADGLNATPNVSRIVASSLSAETAAAVARGLNSNTAILDPLVAALSPEVGTAIAQGLNANSGDMTKQMMAGLSAQAAAAIANGLNNNAQLLTTLLANLNASAGEQAALGLNDSSAHADPVTGEYFLEVVLKNTSTGAAQAIVNAINTPPYGFDSFLSQLVRGLNSASAAAAGHAMGTNPTLLEYIMRNVDGKKMAEIMNSAEGYAFTQALTVALDTDVVAGALNDALATAGGRQFMSDLLANLRGDLVAAALNVAPNVTHDLVAQLSANGGGVTIANAMNAAGPGLLTNLLRYLEPTFLETVINRSISESGGSPWPGGVLSWLWLRVDSQILGLTRARMWTKFTGAAMDAPY